MCTYVSALICRLWWTLKGHCYHLHTTHSLLLSLSVPSCLRSHLIFIPRFSDPSRCFHPFHILSSVGPHLLASDAALSSAASTTAAVRSWTSQIFTVLRGSLQVNLTGRAAAAHFAHLRQSMKITLWDYNTERHTKHKGLHTHTPTCSSPANCWLLVCKSVIACLIKYRISNELH